MLLCRMNHKPRRKPPFLIFLWNGNLKIIIFVSVFWSLQNVPVYAIGTYIPEILAQFGFANGTKEYLGSAVIIIIYLVGLIPALYSIV